MLLTFEQGAEIPTKMHLFFGQTFEVLFYKHDATKGVAFRRKFSTSLTIDEFQSILSAFSAFSYMDYGPTIKRREALKCAKDAIEYFQSDEKDDSFISDLCSSTSILIEEGDTLSYIHRTFQEYFVAVFLSTQNIEEWGDLIERLVREKPNDSVISLLRGINKDRFNREFLAPRLARLCEYLRDIDIDVNPAKAFLLFYFELSTGKDENVGNIQSWTFGIDGKYTKFYYLIDILDIHKSKYFGGENFNWRSHFLKSGAAESRDGSVKLTAIDDKIFIGTPIVDFLKDIRDAATDVSRKISEENNVQRRLLSNTFIKAKKILPPPGAPTRKRRV